MPIYCEPYQLVIPKDVLNNKYVGGVNQFKKDFQWTSDRDHEDSELISIISFGNDFPILQNLHFDHESKTSNDFVIVARYGSPALSWNVDWCDTNNVFIWHKDCKLSSYEKMMQISNMTVDVIEQAFNNGEKLLTDIR